MKIKVGDLVKHKDGRVGFVEWVGKKVNYIVVLPTAHWNGSWWWKTASTKVISSGKDKDENK